MLSGTFTINSGTASKNIDITIPSSLKLNHNNSCIISIMLKKDNLDFYSLGSNYTTIDASRISIPIAAHLYDNKINLRVRSLVANDGNIVEVPYSGGNLTINYKIVLLKIN